MIRDIAKPAFLIVPGLAFGTAEPGSVGRIPERVSGFVFNHPDFPDGTPIKTATVIARTVRRDHIHILTRGGREYLLPTQFRNGYASVELPDGTLFQARLPLRPGADAKARRRSIC